MEMHDWMCMHKKCIRFGKNMRKNRENQNGTKVAANI